MERVDRIISHPLWRESLEKIQKLEEVRVFCKHDFVHFLDVARIAYIESLEKGLPISKELIYSAALLHDIGRHLQYSEGTPHDEAGVDLAEKILTECGFDENAMAQILSAIGSHRKPEVAFSDGLEGVIYRADKKSRNCMLCSAQAGCNWSRERKNMSLQI